MFIMLTTFVFYLQNLFSKCHSLFVNDAYFFVWLPSLKHRCLSVRQTVFFKFFVNFIMHIISCFWMLRRLFIVCIDINNYIKPHSLLTAIFQEYTGRYWCLHTYWIMSTVLNIVCFSGILLCMLIIMYITRVLLEANVM